MVTLLVAMATTTSFDKYDNGYGIYDDGYDSPGDKYQDPLHVEPIKAIPVNAIVYKRISGPQYPIRANSIHYYHMYPIYPIYPYYYWVVLKLQLIYNLYSLSFIYIVYSHFCSLINKFYHRIYFHYYYRFYDCVLRLL